MSAPVQLKPCPFCKGEASPYIGLPVKYPDTRFIRCHKCKATVQADTDKAAAIRWNTRA